MKEIYQEVNESVWEADQRLKRTIRDGGFFIDDTQHKEWFIAMLLPHLCQPLHQQNIATQDEAVEISMKLEATPTPVVLGTQHIQNQLEAMHLEIQILHKDKGKEVCAEVWCIKCKADGNHKD